MRSGRDPCPAIAGTFHRDRHCLGRKIANIAHRQFARFIKSTGQLQQMGIGFKYRNVKMVQQIMSARRRDVELERFKQYTVVAVCQAQFRLAVNAILGFLLFVIGS